MPQADPKLPAGTNFCFCTICREYFNSEAAFSAHRTGKPEARKCLSIEQMIEKGMSRNKKGYWITEKRAEIGQPRVRE